MTLTIFYDGSCPVCVREMHQLKRCDTYSRLNLVNVLDEGFTEKYPNINPGRAMQILHAETQDGTILLGVEANVTAWRTINRKLWLEILRWPLIKPLADMGYQFFAQHRYGISKILLGRSRCKNCSVKI